MPRLPGVTASGRDAGDLAGNRLAEGGMGIGVEVETVNDARLDDAAGIEEMNAP